MDRCRCEEYSAAVRKLPFFCPGTYRKAIIDAFDRKGFAVYWVKNPVDTCGDMMVKPVVQPCLPPKDPLSEEARQLEQMWEPYISQQKKPRKTFVCHPKQDAKQTTRL